MTRITRRQVLGGLGTAGLAAVMRPRRARAAGEVTVWWTQGFYEQENKAIIDSMAD